MSFNKSCNTGAWDSCYIIRGVWLSLVTEQQQTICACTAMNEHVQIISCCLVTNGNDACQFHLTIDFCTFFADFHLTDELKLAVDEAKRKYEEATSKLDVDYRIFDKFGGELIKQSKLSPDSLMQLALQVCCYSHHITLILQLSSIIVILLLGHRPQQKSCYYRAVEQCYVLCRKMT